MQDDRRTIPITKGRPQLVTRKPPPPPLADRRFGERRQPLPPAPLIGIVWPLVVGLCLGIFAPELRYVANMLGHLDGRLIFPFALLAERPEWGYSNSVAKNLSMISLYLQFPVEGALAMLNLRKNIQLGKTVSRLALVHVAAAMLLWLLERPHSR
jgi:hypothetical protein